MKDKKRGQGKMWFWIIGAVLAITFLIIISITYFGEGGFLPQITNSTQEQISNTGDTDGDGVPNQFDQCPNQKGSVSNDGCPPGNNS